MQAIKALQADKGLASNLVHHERRVRAICRGCGRECRLRPESLEARLCRDCSQAEARLGDVLLTSGSTVHFDECDPANPRRCWVTCGKCGTRRLTHPPLGKKLKTWSGLCMTCSKKRRVGDEIHSSGTRIHWGERAPGNRGIVSITCHRCNDKSFISASTVRRPEWLGLCHECTHCSSARIRHLGDEPHPSGTIVHWSRRDPNDWRRIEITCHGCQQSGKYVWSRMALKKDWSGLCRRCFLDAGAWNRWTHDLTLVSGSVIHFGEHGPSGRDSIMVTCGVCKEKRELPRASVMQLYGREKENWPGICRSHSRSELLALLAGRAPQENGNVEKRSRRGRRPGDKYLDEEKSLSDIKDFIVDVWRETPVLDTVTQKAVAARFQRRGEKIGEKAVKRRLERAGITTPWAEFRQSVLRERGEL